MIETMKKKKKKTLKNDKFVFFFTKSSIPSFMRVIPMKRMSGVTVPNLPVGDHGVKTY